MTHFLEKARKFEIQTFDRPESYTELRKTHIPFSGSPRLHPEDAETVMLLVDPYGGSKIYYEFKRSSISYLEELTSLIDIDGDVIPMVRIWVKKRSIGILCSPFIVDDNKPL